MVTILTCVLRSDLYKGPVFFSVTLSVPPSSVHLNGSHRCRDIDWFTHAIGAEGLTV